MHPFLFHRRKGPYRDRPSISLSTRLRGVGRGIRLFAAAVLLAGLALSVRGGGDDPRTVAEAVLPPVCFGDCNQFGEVTVDEIILLVNIVLGSADVYSCPSLAGQPPAINDIIRAVNNALIGCPPIAIRYVLTAGSTILSSPAPAGTNAPTLEEPLSGTFVTVPLPGGPFCLNTLLCLSVATFQFRSAHFNVDGAAGRIQQTTFDPDLVSMGFIGSINGQPIILSGFGAFDANSSYPPTFSGLEVCGAPPGVGGSCAGIRAGTDVGYDVIIFAAPGG